METMYAYTAGIIDGEGSIMLLRERSDRAYRSQPQISVTNTSKALIDFLYSNHGGTITPQKKYQEHHKSAWIWRLRGPRSIDLLTHLVPFMLDESKIHRSNLLINEYHTVTPKNGKYTEALHQAKLNFELRFFHPSTS